MAEQARAELDAGLRTYVDRGSPIDERLLAERCAFEHEVRRFLTRTQERGYAYLMRFPQMPSLWVEFVNQNKAAESKIARLNVRRSYEAGRREATEGVNEGWAPEPKPTSPGRPEAFDPIAMIDRLVQDAVAQRVAQLVPANVAPLVPATAPQVMVEPTKSDGLTAGTTDRLSALLQEFLRPADRKRQHKMKGRGEAEAVVQFAIDLLGDPRMNELTDEKWSSAGRPMPDGARPEAGGWNRIHFIVDDLSDEVARLREAGVQFRNDIVTGPGGSQILLMDPSGNLVELFQPARRQ